MTRATGHRAYSRVNQPQWSPLLVSGMTAHLEDQFTRAVTQPQWSPLLVSGMTLENELNGGGEVCRNGARSW